MTFSMSVSAVATSAHCSITAGPSRQCSTSVTCCSSSHCQQCQHVAHHGHSPSISSAGSTSNRGILVLVSSTNSQHLVLVLQCGFLGFLVLFWVGFSATVTTKKHLKPTNRSTSTSTMRSTNARLYYSSAMVLY